MTRSILSQVVIALWHALESCAGSVRSHAIGSWFDPPKAKESAFAMMDAGADIMYAERFGVSDAAQERGVLAIGNVIDTQADYPDTVVASAIWHFEPTLQAALAAP